MRQAHEYDAPYAENATDMRACEHSGCLAVGEFRAPKSPQQLREYRWFCLEHVRAYNARWNYCAGLSPEQIEEVIRFDTIWNRETKPLGGWRAHQQRIYEAAAHFRDHGADEKPVQRPGLSGEMSAALALFNLSVPYTMVGLRYHYKKLVKRYHPDANGGDKEAEAHLKDVTAAYAVLKRFLEA